MPTPIASSRLGTSFHADADADAGSRQLFSYVPLEEQAHSTTRLFLTYQTISLYSSKFFEALQILFLSAMTDNINATNPDNVERITFIQGSLSRFLREYPELHDKWTALCSKKELRDGLAEAFRKTKKHRESAEEIYLKAYDVAAHAATFGTSEELTVARHNSMTAHEECGIAEEGHQEAQEALREVQATLALEAQSYKNDETRCRKRLKEIQDTLEKAIGEPVKVLKQSRTNVEILRLADIDLCLQSLKTIADPFMLAQECYNLQWHVKRTLIPSLDISHPGEGMDVKSDPETSAIIWID